MLGNQKSVMLFFVLTFIFIFSCQEAGEEKAVDELVQKQKQALQEEKKEVGELINEMEDSEDSLKKSYEKNSKQKSDLMQKLQELEEKETAFKREKRLEELEKIKVEKEKLQQEAKLADETLEIIKTRLFQLEKKEESIEEQIDYISESKKTSKLILHSEMTNIDSVVTNLENERLHEQNKIPILQKKMSISKLKIKAYQDEQELFDSVRINQIRVNASESEIEIVDKKIADIEEDIKTEHLKLADAQLQIANSQTRIVKIESQLETFNNLINDKYSKKEILADFIKIESERLKNELEKINTEKAQLEKQEKLLDKEKEKLARTIREVKSKMDLFTSDETDKVGARQARLDKMEVETAGQEAKIMNEKRKQTTGKLTGSAVDSGAQEADSSLQELTRISQQVARERAELSQKQSEMADERYNVLKEKAQMSGKQASQYKVWGYTLTLIVIAVIVAVFILFFIGRSAKRKK